jgi:hypothetical protein
MLKPSYIDFVKPYMLKPITNAREAVEFICHLFLDHNMFHFETHPEDCIDPTTKQPAFTVSEIIALDARRHELFDHLKDPFVLALCLMEESNQFPKRK